ncbi:hypothetical protein MLD38_039325 [Melastoma candidum]|uniref:Uncharacterized protein n=1 Tax=Melastoma candidum TaxID=119954 RepID=A0ACB9L2X1_9MYRT|nr:hypothetical protein MLD38_039325 [Melastoma candidum]
MEKTQLFCESDHLKTNDYVIDPHILKGSGLAYVRRVMDRMEANNNNSFFSHFGLVLGLEPDKGVEERDDESTSTEEDDDFSSLGEECDIFSLDAECEAREADDDTSSLGEAHEADDDTSSLGEDREEEDIVFLPKLILKGDTSSHEGFD